MTVPPSPPCLAAALDYLARGWSALPLCPADHARVGAEHTRHCRSPGKRPLGTWKMYQECLAAPDALRMLWTRHERCNVGVVLGRVSGLVGVDLDGPEGEELLRELSGGDLPATLEFVTPGGGRRLLYRLAGDGADVPIRTLRRGTGELKVLGEGSLTVMPPSLHVSGGTYAWVPGLCPGEIEPAAAPAWVVNPRPPFCSQLAERVEPHSRSECTTNGTVLERARAYLACCDPAISGRGGHDQTFKVACRLVKGFALAPDDALRLLLCDYNPRCVPPWTEKELRHKVEDAQRSPGEVGYLLDGAAPPPRPSAGRGQEEKKAASALPVLRAQRLDEVQARAVQWLWSIWLPTPKVTMLDGDPGLGKSTLVLDLVARLTTNGVMPDGSQGMTGGAIILTAEDAYDDTVRPRLEAAGADLSRILGVIDVLDGDGPRPVELPRDLPLLEDAVRRVEAKLLVIDPLMAFLHGADASRYGEVQRALYQFKLMIERLGLAVLAQRHLNKSVVQKALYRGLESIAFLAGARNALVVAPDPASPERHRLLISNKPNLGPKPKALRFALEPAGHVCRVAWCGSVEVSADDALGPPEKPEERTARQEAMALLWAMLKDGPRPAREIYAAAKELEISATTLKRAKELLGVQTVQANGGHFGQSVWQLVDSGTPERGDET
jgi:putative DNA primase/helicase